MSSDWFNGAFVELRILTIPTTMFIPTLLLLALWLPPMLAQDYSIPSQWVVSTALHLRNDVDLKFSKNTTCSLNRDARIQLAQGLLDTLSTSFDKGTGQIPSMSTIYSNEL